MYGSEKAYEILQNAIQQDKKIMLIGDPDVDGLMSLKLMCEYMQYLGLDYTYYVNDNRVHGFTLDSSMLSGYLLICADFAIDRKTIKEIVDNGIDIISTDHHEIEANFIEYNNGKNCGVVLNNQYPFEPEDERYNSGAGVVYNLFKSFNAEFASEERDAIVGITLLSDVRPTENKKARRYLARLYNYNEGYIDYLIQNTIKTDFGFGVPKMDRTFVDFTFSPTINALLRFNKTQVAIDLILGNGITDFTDYRKKQTELVRVFVDFTFSPTINALLRFNKTQVAIDLILGNGITDFTDYRKKQTELVRVLKENSDILDLGSCIILAVDADQYSEDVTNFIGLVCSQYKNLQKSSLAFAYSGGKILRASFRGRFDDIDYRKAMQELSIDAQGHKGAFGIKSFYPNAETWKQIADIIGVLECDHKDTRTIIESNNLSVTLLNKGSNYAYENGFVRDMYRTYIRYTGKNAREVKKTYRMVEFTQEDYENRRTPDRTVKHIDYKFELDNNGERIVKYREFNIDGKTVKSFGLGVEDGLIMPILEKGYLNLYLV